MIHASEPARPEWHSESLFARFPFLPGRGQGASAATVIS